ncbi:hypothetical protein [Maricaulis sp.]|uniref:hypothetical protein n=1 Tax=Maricaulis sp. TaxID=1486257 RepID=UPI003A8ED93A
MDEERNTVIIKVEWQGVGLTVEYEHNWLNIDRVPDLRVAHFSIRTREEGAMLPITQTGYRSHFEHPDRVDAIGGPKAYVLAWLDAEAASPDWKARVAASKQLRLF